MDEVLEREGVAERLVVPEKRELEELRGTYREPLEEREGDKEREEEREGETVRERELCERPRLREELLERVLGRTERELELRWGAALREREPVEREAERLDERCGLELR
ncbi:MAG: hypothetical protein CMJ89_19140 [Planctomycetes bacterium]|nr:hypothetical protein [Planctomycetota bacterium]